MRYTRIDKKNCETYACYVLKNQDKSVVTNLNEFVITPRAFEMIMLLDKNSNDEDNDEG